MDRNKREKKIEKMFSELTEEAQKNGLDPKTEELVDKLIVLLQSYLGDK